MVPNKEELRKQVQGNLPGVIARLNEALAGKNLSDLEPTLKRIGRNQTAPHWFDQLKKEGTLPNLDGKTIGSVVEMLLVGVLETGLLKDTKTLLRVNPARGVDLPDLDLGIKSPSKNFCTSEPFFSAYERLLGSEYDALILLTDYQEKKKKPPLRLQITNWRYLTRTQIADKKLCSIARRHIKPLIETNEAWAKRIARFLAWVNQSDWRAKQILRMVETLDDDERTKQIIASSPAEFAAKNAQRTKKENPILPEAELTAVTEIGKVKPLKLGVIDAAENWVVEAQKDLGRAPNDNEWARILASPLDGQIGMSLALQWRYNFGQLFNAPEEAEEEDGAEEAEEGCN